MWHWHFLQPDYSDYCLSWREYKTLGQLPASRKRRKRGAFRAGSSHTGPPAGAREQARGSVVGEASAAVRSGIQHVWRLRGLTVLQRFLVACLKIVAILGYHYGKWSAAAVQSVASATPARNGFAQRKQEQAATVASNGCDTRCNCSCGPAVCRLGGLALPTVRVSRRQFELVGLHTCQPAASCLGTSFRLYTVCLMTMMSRLELHTVLFAWQRAQLQWCSVGRQHST
jgi:hypothetical protein